MAQWGLNPVIQNPSPSLDPLHHTGNPVYLFIINALNSHSLKKKHTKTKQNQRGVSLLATELPFGNIEGVALLIGCRNISVIPEVH